MLALATLPGPAAPGIPGAADRASRGAVGFADRGPAAITQRGGPLPEADAHGRTPDRPTNRSIRR
ncbi:hypothetical protein [Streptomyces sp. PTY087I2]|uniref:hypothetical protein n=1 Tax=Streptomyces sp. PTY087I2 TaxID=1819298 RepID=UPI00080BA279|nr:hypothetical protein [Streptomyces sp. PTY087I2]OCC12272.1 hypothetical protein A3Q37_01932 [Streptomyces sp. PTY087I2]